MQKIFITALALLVLALFSCNNNIESEFPDEFFLKSSKANFVSADKNFDYNLISNRNKVSDWETFNFIQTSDSLVLQTKAHQNVRLNSKKQLIFGSSEDDRNEKFYALRIDSSHYILKTKENHFIRLDSIGILIADELDENKAEIFEIGSTKEQIAQLSFLESIFLYLGIALIFLSIYYYFFLQKQKLSLILLLLGGFSLRMFFGFLEPYFYIWDEQFHALVAKNMANDPLHPMLYKNALFNSDTFSWIGSHTWLHKQPLFLWQMALSIKIFGANAIAARLPSIIMSTIVIWFIYRIGSILLTKRTGYFAAIIFACSHFSLELVAGGYATEHNDIAFMFYVTASFWAWFEYKIAKTKKRKFTFIVLIGVLSGFAILTKWLVGLLVFSGWGVSLLFIKENRKELKNFIHFGLSLFITCIVFLPWQIYIITRFPEQSMHEYKMNSSHFFKIIEEHGGDWLFHFNQTNYIFGFSFLLMALFYVVLIRKIKLFDFKISISVSVILLYVFFTLAKTKMIAFTFVISPFGFLAIGSALETFYNLIIINPQFDWKKKISKSFQVIILITVLISVFNYDETHKDHIEKTIDKTSEQYKRINNTKLFYELNSKLKKPDKTILFNTANYEHIQAMYFSNIASAYDGIPSELDINKCVTNGYKVAIIFNENLPDYIINNSEIKIIKGYLF